MQAPTVKCYGYTRVSTEKQADEGVSLSAQADLIRKKAEFLGMELVKIYCDAGISGGKEERPQLQELLSVIGKGECIIVYDLSRLTRDMAFYGKLQYDFKKKKIRLISIGENTDSNNEDNQYMMNFKAIMSDMEWKAIKRKVKAAMDQKRELGEHIGKVPYGYRPKGKLGDGRGIEEVPEEQAIIRQIKDMRDGNNGYEETTYAEITRQLNNQRAPRVKSAKEWNSSTVRSIYLRGPIATKGRLDRGREIPKKIEEHEKISIENEISELKKKEKKSPAEYDRLISLLERKNS